MMKAFRFKDLNRVYWPATSKLALARGLAAGLVMVFFGLLTGPSSTDMLSILLLPFIVALVSLPLGLGLRLAAYMTSFVPIIGGFVALACLFFGMLVTTIGDPLVYFANRRWPDLFDIEDFKFFNLDPLILILEPEW